MTCRLKCLPKDLDCFLTISKKLINSLKKNQQFFVPDFLVCVSMSSKMVFVFGFRELPECLYLLNG